MLYLADVSRAPEYRVRLERLSETETSILEALVMGFDNRRIAETLRLSVTAVKEIRAAVRVKLHAETLADMVRIAVIGAMLDQGV